MTRRIIAAAAGIALAAAFSGEAYAATEKECVELKARLEQVKKLIADERERIPRQRADLQKARQLRDVALKQAQLTNKESDRILLRARTLDIDHVESSLNLSQRILKSYETFDAKEKLRVSLECDVLTTAQTPPQTPSAPQTPKPPVPQTATAPQPATPPPAPASQQTTNPPPTQPPKTTAQPTSATRPAFDLRGNVRTYCENTPTFMDYAPVEVSVNAKGEAIGGFYRKGKTLLMKGEMDGGGVIRLKVLDAPEIVIEVRTSKSQGLWHGTGTFVNPPAEVSRCYPGNIGLSESKELPDPMRFPNPTFKGYAVSNCRDFGGVGCGLPAATAFCLTEGYFRATEHKIVVDGAQAWVLGSDKVCNDPGCGRLVDVVCTRK